MYRRFSIEIIVNGLEFHVLLIDPHVFIRHGESVNEFVVLQLVNQLNGREVDPVDENGGFSYFASENLSFMGKLYRMVWLIPPDKNYLGVRTAFRRND